MQPLTDLQERTVGQVADSGKAGLRTLYASENSQNQGTSGNSTLPVPVPATPSTIPAPKQQSSTVISNAPVIEDTIPTNNSRLTALSTKGTTIGADGLERYSDGSLVTKSVTSPGGGNYTLDNNGQIIAGPTGGDYQIGSNISQYKEDNPSTATGDDYYQKEMDMLDSMKANLDANTKAAIDNIQQQFALRKTQQTEINRQQEAGRKQSLLIGGSSRYAQLSSNGIMTTQETNGVQELAQLDAEENNLINQAKTAQTNGDFQLMDKQLALAESKRQEKAAAAQKLNASIVAENNKIKEQVTQSTRDTAIADLFSSGTTDPAKILSALNKDGGNYTLDEIGKALDTITKNNGFKDLKSLSGSIQDFYIQKENNSLPSNIESLPENEQLKAYLDYIKPTKAVGVGTVKKITLTEAKSQGLPLSVVGMTESDLVNSLQSEEPPKWFVEKTQSEEGMVLSTQNIKTQWDKYRQTFGGKTKTQTTQENAASANKEKATNYFKTAYGDAVDAEAVGALADQVQFYIDGGMTYAKAMEQTIKDASQ